MVNCPKCNAILELDADKCDECGTVFNEKTLERRRKSLKQKSQSKKIPKALAYVIAGLIALVGIIFIFTAIFGNSGEKTAYKLSERIGKSVQAAQRHADIVLEEKSASSHINKLNEADENHITNNSFDHIYESTKIVKIDGIHVPKWVIRVKEKDGEVAQVSYYDYTAFKKSYKGTKRKDSFDTDVIKVDMKMSKVQDLIKIDPYEIIYTESNFQHSYMYYFINDNKDEERRAFTVTYNYDNEVTGVI